MPPSSQQRAQPAAPTVRVEVRHGPAPPVGFDVGTDEFVIGATAAADLRLPGSNLPAQVCSIQRTADGARLRKIAPALPILLNGTPLPPLGHADLRHGDVVSVGPVDLHISIGYSIARPATIRPAPEAIRVAEPAARLDEWERQRHELEARAKAIEEQARELEADRVLWYERRQEIEREIHAAREGLNSGRREHDHSAVVAELRSKVEQEVNDEYRSRREELERMQLAVREAAVQLRERKQQFEDGIKNVDPRLKELDRREKELAAREKATESALADLRRKHDAFEAERQTHEQRYQQREQDMARREVELAARELAARELAVAAEKDRVQYQSDLVRVDRLSAALEAKEKSLEGRAVEVDRRYEQFQQDTRDFEEQLKLFDDREDRAKDEDARLAARREELDAREARLNGRIAEIETQQATLVALRTRLEHLRDELRSQEARLADERARTEEEVRAADDQLRKAETVREQIETEKDGHAESYRLYQERSTLMSQAVERLRAMQEQLTTEGERLRKLDEDLSAKAAEQAEQAGLVKAKAEQLLASQQRVEADRRALKERDSVLLQAEEAREVLQEQLRLRSEELATRQREVDERSRQLDVQARELAEQLKNLEDLRADATSARRLTEEEAAILAQRDEKLRVAEQTIAEQKRQLEEAQTRFEREQIYAEERLADAHADVEELKSALALRTEELLAQMPDLEQRAQAALDRTAHARETMRAQLAELHSYALKSQDDLEAVRAQVQQELARVRDEEQALHRARTEHRLAVSSFRQQLIEWQGRFADLKQAIHHGETRLDRREKAAESTAQELAARAEEVLEQEREVAEKRSEVDRHLGDMQAWFRKKFREIAETRWSKYRGQEAGDKGQGTGDTAAGSGDSGILQLPPRPSTENSVLSTENAPGVILPLPDDLEPADRKLGDLLRSLDIVDRDTLHVLWDEARRQRRTLRQVLLAGGYLTLYQLALIESGNLNGLILGRFRVIDRLLATARETVYRVFDPQLRSQDDGTCLLRHLGEAEMLDAVRPDEYRQRFGSARDLAHPNVAATLELLEINGRPAVAQEWLHGLTGSDWPAAVSSPGVWHRLVMQAALALHAAHSAGLTHGRLTANSFLLTRQGVVKLIGIGEPPWLHPGGAGGQASVAEDLKALGHVAEGWMQGGRRKGVRPKPFPAALVNVLRGLGVNPEGVSVPLAVYASAAALLEDLDKAARSVPADQGTWDKLLAYVDENAGDGIVLRQSA
jgi:DNA repair exonuclease SbcCD ATPase subunit